MFDFGFSVLNSWFLHVIFGIWHCGDGITAGFHSNESPDFRPSQSTSYDILHSSWLSSVSCFIVFFMSDMLIFCWFCSYISAFIYCLCVAVTGLLFVLASCNKYVGFDELTSKKFTRQKLLFVLCLHMSAVLSVSCHQYMFGDFVHLSPLQDFMVFSVFPKLIGFTVVRLHFYMCVVYCHLIGIC